MLYSDFKKIYEESGSVAAALCIHEIEDLTFYHFAMEFPDIAHLVAVENMNSYGINFMLGLDRNWLSRVDTTKFNIYMVRSIMLAHPLVDHLDVSKFNDGDWSSLLLEVPQIITKYRDLIFSQMGIITWHFIANRHSKLYEEFDSTSYYDLINNQHFQLDYRNYLSLLTIKDVLDGKGDPTGWY